MALVQINKNPSAKELSWFGALFAAFFGIVGYLAWRKPDYHAVAPVLWAVGVIVPAVYYAIPSARKPIYMGWMYLAFPLGLVVSYVVLGIVYFGVVTPVAVALRITGRDPLQRKFDPARPTYWTVHRTGDDPSRYFSQF